MNASCFYHLISNKRSDLRQYVHSREVFNGENWIARDSNRRRSRDHASSRQSSRICHITLSLSSSSPPILAQDRPSSAHSSIQAHFHNLRPVSHIPLPASTPKHYTVSQYLIQCQPVAVGLQTFQAAHCPSPPPLLFGSCLMSAGCQSYVSVKN